MCITSEGEVLVQPPVQLGDGADLSRVEVDGEKNRSPGRAKGCTVPQNSLLVER